MRWRRKRTTPTVTELLRVQKVLEADRALSRLLGPKSALVAKRTGEPVYFAPETITVAQALRARDLNPERTSVGTVLGVAHEVLRNPQQAVADEARPAEMDA